MGKFPVEEYKKTGFDFGGYLELEVTSDSEYPDYLQQEAKDTIKKVLVLKTDKTELLMDIITVDTKNRTVNLTRVGSGEDRSYNY